MIVQDIVLDSIDWCVRVYYAVDTYYADEITDDLICLGCSGEKLKEAKSNLWSEQKNQGLTFANTETREAIIVIGLTTNASQFFNSLLHEILHLLSYIAITDNLDPYGEDICYVGGELAQKMYKKAKGLMCECCRRKNIKMYD